MIILFKFLRRGYVSTVYLNKLSKKGNVIFVYTPLIAECFARYDAFRSLIFDYACVMLIAIEEVRNYGKIVCIKNILKMVGVRMHTYPASYPPGSAPGHKQQKPSKESGMFQCLGTVNFVLLLLKGTVKWGGGAWHNAQKIVYKFLFKLAQVQSQTECLHANVHL